jgi:tetratricopeptide (TPR) repeat protein
LNWRKKECRKSPDRNVLPLISPFKNMTTGATKKSGSGFLPLALLAAAAFLAYSPVLKADYTNWDDPAYTYENASIQSFSAANLKAIFGSIQNCQYLPVSTFSFLLENTLFGEKAAVHHAVNLLLHCLNACLAFIFLHSFSGKKKLSFAAALLWTLHPANVESVAWIAERKNVLYAFFYLAALISYQQNLLTGGRLFYAAALGLCIAAMGAKPAAVTLPLALLLLEASRGNGAIRAIALRTAPFFAAAACFTAISVWAQSASGKILPAQAPALFSFYILKTLAPVELSAMYPYNAMLNVFKARPALYALPALAFAAAFYWACKRNKRAAWGMAFFTLHILPYVSLIPVGSVIAADRFLYMPALGFIYALLEAASGLAPNSARARNILLVSAAALSLLSGAAVFQRSRVWTSDLALWTDTTGKFPLDIAANLNLAQALIKAGRPGEAAARYEIVLRHDASNVKALYNLGTLHGLAGRYAPARALLKRALALDPENGPAWNNLGLLDQNQGHRSSALKAFLTATAVDPDYAPAYVNLSAGEAGAGRCAAAQAHYLQALRLGFRDAPEQRQRLARCR